MVIKYSIDELNAIGEMVLIRECISRMPEYQVEPQYHPVYVPEDTTGKTIIAAAQSTTDPLPNSISADNFLQDFAQFQRHLDQAIQFNRDTSWQQQQHWQMLQYQQQQLKYVQNQQQAPQLSASVADFFKKAQQHFHTPQPYVSVASTTAAQPSIPRARRLSEVEAELLGQFRGRIDI